MSLAADRARDARRITAAPGGLRDRIVHLAALGLPALVGAVLAVMIVLPLFPQNEVSFLLDRNRVAVTEDRLAVHAANYRGQDDQGRAFTVSAGDAIQHSASVPVVNMTNLDAHMQLADGSAEAIAPSGTYHINSDQMEVQGPVRMTTTTGYAMTTSGVTIDLRKRLATGTGGVSGETPYGPFGAERMSADLNAQTLSLDGHAHLRMTPGARAVRR